MAATAQLLYYNGTTPDSADVLGGEVRHKRADNNTIDLNDPTPIPSTGSNYAWPKHFKMNWTTAPPSSISNLRLYADPTPQTGHPTTEWAGMTLWAGVTATYSQSTASDETSLRGGLTDDCDTFTSASPLTINSGTVVGTTTGTGTQDYLILQLEVLSSALPGTKGGRNLYYRYEEQ